MDSASEKEAVRNEHKAVVKLLVENGTVVDSADKECLKGRGIRQR